jgi:hypothetical protein
LIGLAELRVEGDELQLDVERPILIDPSTRRGAKCELHCEQVVQRATPAKVVRLRECA